MNLLFRFRGPSDGHVILSTQELTGKEEGADDPCYVVSSKSSSACTFGFGLHFVNFINMYDLSKYA